MEKLREFGYKFDRLSYPLGKDAGTVLLGGAFSKALNTVLRPYGGQEWVGMGSLGKAKGQVLFVEPVPVCDLNGSGDYSTMILV